MKPFPPLHNTVRSKLRGSIAAVMIAASIVPSSASAATLWSTDFKAPAYTVGATVIGKEGWTAVLNDSGNPLDAALVSFPAASGGTALRINSSSTLGSSMRRTRLDNVFEKVTGPKVEISISVAFQWTGSSTNGAAFAFHTPENNSPVLVSFTATEGLQFSGTYTNLSNATFLPVAQMAQGELYRFRFVFDFEDRVFSMAVNGVDADGKALNYTIDGVGFRSGTPVTADGISAIRLINNRGDYIQYYVDSIEVQSVPESGTVAMFGVGGAFLLGGNGFRRWRKTLR